jgi:uncharacterized membrane protein YqgA involved in biofilm formation
VLLAHRIYGIEVYLFSILVMWAAITAMLSAAQARSSVNSELLSEIVVCGGVIPVLLGSIRTGRPRWAVGLLGGTTAYESC